MDAFTGEIRAFPYNFTPEGWLECNGDYMSIQQYTMLYAVIGIIYGGNGSTNFQLPNLYGTAPVSSGHLPGGADYYEGLEAGWNQITLATSQIPAHNHTFSGASIPGIGLISKLTNQASSQGDSYVSNVVTRFTPTTGVPGRAYSSNTPNATIAEESMNPTGHNISHENMQPFLTMRYFICYDGYWPPRP